MFSEYSAPTGYSPTSNEPIPSFSPLELFWSQACLLGFHMEAVLPPPTHRSLGSLPVDQFRVAQPILLVDDDPTILELVRTILQLDGYAVLSATCGAQALSIAEENCRIGLVLSDVVMPGMNGIQLCESLKALRPKLKCILMSGYDMGLVAAERDAYFLPKPFVPRELLGKVQEVLALQA